MCRARAAELPAVSPINVWRTLRAKRPGFPLRNCLALFIEQHMGLHTNWGDPLISPQIHERFANPGGILGPLLPARYHNCEDFDLERLAF